MLKFRIQSEKYSVNSTETLDIDSNFSETLKYDSFGTHLNCNCSNASDIHRHSDCEVLNYCSNCTCDFYCSLSNNKTESSCIHTVTYNYEYLYSLLNHNGQVSLDCFPFFLNPHDHDFGHFLDVLEIWISICINLRNFNVSDGITNLSSHTLSCDETQVLSNGLTFCPTPKPTDLGEFNLELQRFLETSN